MNKFAAFFFMPVLKSGLFIFIVFFFMFVFSSTAYGSENSMNFKLQKNLLTSDLTLRLYFLNSSAFDRERYIIKPAISEGLVSIYDESKDRWVNEGDLWTNLPFLAPSMLLKTAFLSSDTARIHLLIYDTKTAKIYQTRAVKIWNHRNFKNYIDLLNKNLMAGPKEPLIVEETVLPQSDETGNNTSELNLIAPEPKFILRTALGVFIFVFFAALVFLSMLMKHRNDKITLWFQTRWNFLKNGHRLY